MLLKLPSSAKKHPGDRGLEAGRQARRHPAGHQGLLALGRQPPPGPHPEADVAAPLTTLGPSGPREAPLPRLREAATRRSSGSFGAADWLPSAMASRLGSPGPSSPPRRRSTPTARPPRVGTTTTGQSSSQAGPLTRGGGGGAGGWGGGGRNPSPPRPISRRAFSGVPWGEGRVGSSSSTGAAPAGWPSCSSPSTKGPKRKLLMKPSSSWKPPPPAR